MMLHRAKGCGGRRESVPVVGCRWRSILPAKVQSCLRIKSTLPKAKPVTQQGNVSHPLVSVSSDKQLQGLADATLVPPSLHLEGHRVGVFWDLDNIPAGPPAATLVLIRRVKEILKQNGADIMDFKLYGNERTMSQYKGCQDLFKVVGVDMVEVRTAKGAADVSYISDAYFFSRAYMSEACVVVMTGDKGVLPILQYMTGIDVYTIVISTFSPCRYLPVTLPLRLDGDDMATSCRAAIAWDRSTSSPVTEDERQFVKSAALQVECEKCGPMKVPMGVKGCVSMLWINDRMQVPCPAV